MAVSELPGNPHAVWTVKKDSKGTVIIIIINTIIIIIIIIIPIFLQRILIPTLLSPS